MNTRTTFLFLALIAVHGIAFGQSSFTNVAQMRAFNATTLRPGTTARVSGFSSISDGGGGDFVYVSSSSEATNNVTVYRASPSGRWKRMNYDTVDVRWAGAKGDGVTDDTAAIQAAINSFPTNSSSVSTNFGGTLLFPSGTYRTTSTLSVPMSGVRMTGVGRGASALLFDHDGIGIRYYNGYSGLNQHGIVENLRFLGTSTNWPLGSGAVQFEYARGFAVRDCWFINAQAEFGLRTTNSIEFTVERNYVDGAGAGKDWVGYGIDLRAGINGQLSGPNVIQVLDNLLVNCRYAAIRIEGNDRFSSYASRIVGNTIENHGGSGIVIRRTKNLLIANNYFEDMAAFRADGTNYGYVYDTGPSNDASDQHFNLNIVGNVFGGSDNITNTYVVKVNRGNQVYFKHNWISGGAADISTNTTPLLAHFGSATKFLVLEDNYQPQDIYPTFTELPARFISQRNRYGASELLWPIAGGETFGHILTPSETNAISVGGGVGTVILTAAQGWTNGVVVTNLVDGGEGQVVTLIAASGGTTIQNQGSIGSIDGIRLSPPQNWTMPIGATLTLGRLETELAPRWIELSRSDDEAKAASYSGGETYPSVTNGITVVTLANGVATTITNLSSAIQGQIVTLVASTANNTIEHKSTSGDGIRLADQSNWTMSIGDTLTLVRYEGSVGNRWLEVGRYPSKWAKVTVGSDTVTDLTGSGLAVVGGALTVTTTGGTNASIVYVDDAELSSPNFKSLGLSRWSIIGSNLVHEGALLINSTGTVWNPNLKSSEHIYWGIENLTSAVPRIVAKGVTLDRLDTNGATTASFIGFDGTNAAWAVPPASGVGSGWVAPGPATSTASLTPDFSTSTVALFTLTNNATLNAPTGITTNNLYRPHEIWVIQDATGGRTLTFATNYLFGFDITSAVLTTNAGYRDLITFRPRQTNILDVVGHVGGYIQ